MTKTAFRLPQYQNPNFESAGANFNDLQTVNRGVYPQRSLTRADLARADKPLRRFKAPKSVNLRWAKAELLADPAL
jgi:hypothetical protein